jgi:glycosyltransferase involved in cell wall biosynthesis
MIVKNEDACLGRCLESVHRFVDEIIVVDTGSTDNTVHIAESYGAKLYHHPWENDFSKHRNQSLSYATGDWIQQVDADEEMFIEDGPALWDLVRQGKADYFFLRYYDLAKEGSVMTIFNLIRLFRNGRGMYFTQKVHNQLQATGKGAFSAVRFRHYGYNLSEEKMEAKHRRTTTLLREMIADNPEDAYSHHQLAASYSMHREFDRVVEHGEAALDILRRKGLNNEFFVATFYIVAQAYNAVRKSEEAERIALEGLEFFPMHLDVCHLLAVHYFKKQDADRCKHMALRYLEIYEAFTRQPPALGCIYCHVPAKRSEVLFDLACVYFIEGAYDQADNGFQRAFEDSGRQREKAEGILRLYLDNGLQERAIRWLMTVFAADFAAGVIPDLLGRHKHLYLQVAEVFLAKGHTAGTRACLEQAGDVFLSCHQQVEKRLLEARYDWLQKNIDDLIGTLDSLVRTLDVRTLRLVETQEDLGRIAYDIAEVLGLGKQWSAARSALQLAVQIAPAAFDANRFVPILESTGKTIPG